MVCWFSSVWRHFDWWNWLNLRFSGIFFRTHGRNGLKFSMLVYLRNLVVDIRSHNREQRWVISSEFCVNVMRMGFTQQYQQFKWIQTSEHGVNLSLTVCFLKIRIMTQQCKQRWRCHMADSKYPRIDICGPLYWHIHLDKMAAISQTTFSSALLWMKSFVFRLEFHWNLFQRAQSTISQHWFM